MESIFTELAATSSRLEKEAILKKHHANETLKRVLFLALDPYTQFYIRKIPQYEQIGNTDIGLEESLNQLHLLSSRTITGNAAIGHLKNVLCNLPAEKAKVIERIIEKDL